MKVRVSGNDNAPGSSLWLWCPGCNDTHRVTVGVSAQWQWNGNEEAPTIDGSILVQGVQWPADHSFHKAAHAAVPSGGETVCHSLVEAGQWRFLADCTHALRGQTVPMVDLP